MTPLCIVLVSLLGWQGPPTGGSAEEIKEIFRQIEKDMQEIDRLLLEAGTRQAGEEMEKVSKKIDELLRQTLERQKKVSQSIEEILKKIPPDGGRGSGDPSSKSPNDSEPQSEREREKTPVDPGQIPPQREPENPQPEIEKGENRKAPPPRRPPPDPSEQQNVGGRWGELPPLYQELFRNESTDEIPVRYRKWIEDYYRRVNRARR